MFARYINLFFVSWIFVLTASCGFTGSSSSNDVIANGTNAHLVLVEVAPGGKSPEVFFDDHEAVCRRGMPDPGESELDPLETEGEAVVGGEAVAPGTPEERTAIIPVNVASNWFSMGLNIANRSEKYLLVIEQLVFVMSAQWGTEVLRGRKEISSGYCETDPLYIIPYGRIKYEPSRKNHPNNLTLFVDGVPVPTGPPVTSQQPGAAGGGTGAQPGGGQQPGGATQQTPGIGALSQNDEYVPDNLPPYRVQLVLHGYFITKERKYVANFKKDIIFYTVSSFVQ